MAYTIERDAPVAAEIPRLIEDRVEAAIGHIDGDMDSHKTVHEVRKRCKEVRAALRLVRPEVSTYSEENAHYRDAARRLSDIRDVQAAVEVFDDHVRPAVEDSQLQSETLDDVRRELVEHRDDLATPAVIETRLDSVRVDLVEGRERLPALSIDGEGYDAMAGGLGKTYGRARTGLVDAYDDPTFDTFHEWRKRVGYHRDHTGLLSSGWDGPMAARRAELQTLAEVLGDETDLAELATTMHEEEFFEQNTREILAHVIKGLRSELQRRARPLGERLFAETDATIVDRFEQYWNATLTIDHDASDLTMGADQRQSKPKPNPDSDGTDDETQTERPALMEQYSDRWYEPDSDTYEYAVRTPDGNRAYRKTEEGALAVLEQYYETDSDSEGTT